MHTLKGSHLKILSESSDDKRDILLANRGISPDIENVYFNPVMNQLHDPYLFEGMDRAVARIGKAIEDGERIVVFGDYDVDGVSSTAMLTKFLSQCGAKVSYRLPHRAHDGYGLKRYFIDELKALDVKLVITVDCGTRDIDVIDHAVALGIDMIVTDHHNIPDIIPEKLVALINPKLPSSRYPNRNLSGSGVAFKLLHAVANHFHQGKDVETILKRYIDFAMLGTISDCMELKGENRTIAALGLRQLKDSHSHGLRRLIKGDSRGEMNADIVGFRIGPMLNAAGRMDTPYKALKLLLASESSLDEAMSEIESLNERRRTSTERFAIDAKATIDSDAQAIFYDSPEIGHGIIGLIAGRLSEAYNKVAVVCCNEGEKLVGSIRGPDFINIVSILDGMKDYFEAYGGHNQAAGFTILKDSFLAFKKDFTEAVGVHMEGKNLRKDIIVDCEIDIDDVDSDLLSVIESMQPFGIGNPKPLFFARRLVFDDIRYLGKENKHLKSSIMGSPLDFKAFGFGEYHDQLKATRELGIIFEIERNIWNGRESISINIKDFLL